MGLPENRVPHTHVYIHTSYIYIYIRSCTPTNGYLLVSPIFKLTWLSFQPWQRHVHFELPRFYVQDYILVPSDDTRPLLCAAGMTPTGPLPTPWSLIAVPFLSGWITIGLLWKPYNTGSSNYCVLSMTRIFRSLDGRLNLCDRRYPLVSCH